MDKNNNNNNNEDDLKIVSDDDSCETKIKKLKEELRECKKVRDEYLAGWQRSKADMINARKDEEKSREEFRKFSERAILEEFLELADYFEMVLFSVPELPETSKQWFMGIENIYARLTQIMEKRGMVSLESPIGRPFNPEEHEAADQVSVKDEKKDGIVIEEIRKGYKMHGKIIRAARVKVGIYEKITN